MDIDVGQNFLVVLPPANVHSPLESGLLLFVSDWSWCPHNPCWPFNPWVPGMAWCLHIWPWELFCLGPLIFHKLNWLKPTNTLPKLAPFDMSTSQPLLAQDFSCIHRLGQQRVVKVYEYSIAESFNATQLRRHVRKAVPVSLRPLPLTIRPRNWTSLKRSSQDAGWGDGGS